MTIVPLLPQSRYSQYFELGDTKYLVVPKGTVRETSLVGEGYGGYTLTTAGLGGDGKQVIETELFNATVTPQMRATYRNDGSSYSMLSTDLDGDGVVDSLITLTGEEATANAEATYDQVREYIESLKIKKGDRKAWLTLLKLAEQMTARKHKKINKADFFLQLLKKLVHHHAEKGKMTKKQESALRAMLEWLIANN